MTELRLDHTAKGLFGALNALLSNRVTGLGTGRDKTQYAEVNTAIYPLNSAEISSLYRKSGVIQRAINTYPKDSMQAGWKLDFGSDGDEVNPEELEKYFRKLQGWKLKKAIQRAAFYSRMHGDGFIIMGVADGENPDEPLDLEKVRSLRWLLPLSKKNINPVGDWRNPEYFELVQMGANDGLRFHNSRVARIVGVELDDYELERNGGFNDSIVQCFWSSFCAYYPGLQSASIMVQDHRLRLMKIKDLLKRLEDDEDSNSSENQRALMNRILVNDMARSVARTEVVDQEREELTNLTNQYNGVDKIIEQLKDAWASDADMSRIQLFNLIGVSGLQSGEAFKMARLDHAYRLNSWMVSQLEEPLTKIYEVAITADDSPIDNDYDDWSIKFPLLYKMTPIEEMEYQSMAADRDEKYMGMGVFQAEEVRQQFYGTEPNFNIILDEALEIDEDEEQESEEVEQRADGDWLVFFGGRRTGIVVSAKDRNEAIRKARKKKKRGGSSATARQMNATERRQAKAGRWVRTGAKGEKPGQLKTRGYGPKPKSYRGDSLPPPEAIAKAKAALQLLEENREIRVDEKYLAMGQWLASFDDRKESRAD